MEEADFWRNYFCRVAHLRTQAGLAPLLSLKTSEERERDASGEITCSAGKLAAEARWAAGAVGDGPVGGSGGAAAGSGEAGAGTAAPQQVEGMEASLVSILTRLGLERHVSTLEDEELFSVAMLQSMGPMLEPNMVELGIGDPATLARLKAALGMS